MTSRAASLLRAFLCCPTFMRPVWAGRARAAARAREARGKKTAQARPRWFSKPFKQRKRRRPMSSVNVTAGFGTCTPDLARLALGLEGLMGRAARACPDVASGMRTPNPARLSLGLSGLMERAAQACPEAAASPVVDFAFGGKWLAARLRDGSCGRAFTFM